MGDAALNRLLPSWVEPDPLRGRAIDALGLQATADRIADVLLPGLSVQTTRARYYALLAWARRACGAGADEAKIHRIEVALAVREAKLHPKESSPSTGAWRCRFVGSRNLPRRPIAVPYEKPPEPHEAYRVPVWRAYRASMQSLGLLDDAYGLTDDNGTRLATAFSRACKPDPSGRVMLPKSACLSEITRSEGEVLERQLGVWRKGKVGTDVGAAFARRSAVERELRGILAGDFSVEMVLAQYEARQDREPSLIVGALREAAVWERLSVGLSAVFLLWLKHIRAPAAARSILAAARRKKVAVSVPFSEIAVDDDGAGLAIQSVRRALKLRERLGKQDGLRRCDPSAFELGEALVGTAPLEDVLAEMDARHRAAKGDDAWVRRGHRGLELARDSDDKWALPAKARLHGYRLPAFASVLTDLRRARSRG